MRCPFLYEKKTDIRLFSCNVMIMVALCGLFDRGHIWNMDIAFHKGGLNNLSVIQHQFCQGIDKSIITFAFQ